MSVVKIQSCSEMSRIWCWFLMSLVPFAATGCTSQTSDLVSSQGRQNCGVHCRDMFQISNNYGFARGPRNNCMLTSINRNSSDGFVADFGLYFVGYSQDQSCDFREPFTQLHDLAVFIPRKGHSDRILNFDGSNRGNFEFRPVGSDVVKLINSITSAGVRIKIGFRRDGGSIGTWPNQLVIFPANTTVIQGPSGKESLRSIGRARIYKLTQDLRMARQINLTHEIKQLKSHSAPVHEQPITQR